MTIPGSRLEKLYHLRNRINDEIRIEERRTGKRQTAMKAAPRTVENRLAALGITARHVKTWAVEQGLLAEVKQGRLSGLLLDAYLDAHPQEAGRA